MAAPVFIILTSLLLLLAYLLLRKRDKPATTGKHKSRIFSDAWKRIDGEETPIVNKPHPPPQPAYQPPKHYNDKDEDFITDFFLRTFKSRRSYYREVYLKSAAWQRKRYLVLKRDNWRCVHCNRPATQVHHKRYARKIGKEPLHWLVSVCHGCHDRLH